MAVNAGIATGSSRRRRWLRFQFALPVRVTLEKRQQVSVIQSRSSQVNGGGLCFLADDGVFGEADLVVGDEAEITLTDYNLTLTGVIRNRVGDHCGVQFLITSAEDAEHLGRFRQMLGEKVGCLHA